MLDRMPGGGEYAICNVYIPPSSSKHFHEAYDDILGGMYEQIDHTALLINQCSYPALFISVLPQW